ncbi:hypothetical protein BDW59DRAFT_148931 [Aspergillus cavernicola]|uniref:Uncharacterized protein n=1 Tax=Aspergillus cavernicola TaxID=176166 RepID=A0ABR4I6A7_9EURO
MSEPQETSNPQIAIWREILQDGKKSWVLFEHGTCVILMEPADDLAEQATQILSTWGPVHAGSSAGDFNTIELDNPLSGWVVTGHHQDVLNYVFPENVKSEPSSLVVGLLGRGNRERDADSRKIVHVEDNRG